jgi:hypothetical protein
MEKGYKGEWASLQLMLTWFSFLQVSSFPAGDDVPDLRPVASKRPLCLSVEFFSEYSPSFCGFFCDDFPSRFPAAAFFKTVDSLSGLQVPMPSTAFWLCSGSTSLGGGSGSGNASLGGGSGSGSAPIGDDWCLCSTPPGDGLRMMRSAPPGDSHGTPFGDHSGPRSRSAA